MHHMGILGWVGYVLLVYLAIMWAAGVRLKLGVGVPAIITSLFFSSSALIILISGKPLIHSLWIIPLGYLVPFVVAWIFPKYSFLAKVLIFFGSIYAGIIRIGIDKNKIRQAQMKDAMDAVESLAKKRESE